MRRLLLAAAAFAAVMPLQAAAGDGLSVPVDQAVRVPLRGPAAEVVVGSPRYVDVTVVDSRTVLVHGKDIGITNLVVYDPSGRPVFNDRIVVMAATGDQVSVFRAAKGYEYACGDRCEDRGARDDFALQRMRTMAAPK